MLSSLVSREHTKIKCIKQTKVLLKNLRLIFRAKGNCIQLICRMKESFVFYFNEKMPCKAATLYRNCHYFER